MCVCVSRETGGLGAVLHLKMPTTVVSDLGFPFSSPSAKGHPIVKARQKARERERERENLGHVFRALWVGMYSRRSGTVRACVCVPTVPRTSGQFLPQLSQVYAGRVASRPPRLARDKLR